MSRASYCEIILSLLMVIVMTGWSGPVFSQDSTPRQDFGPERLSGYYSLYSGALGDEVLWPSKKDAKVRFTVSGRAAARMFDYMGSGATQKESCEESEVTRARDELMCTRDKSTQKTECYFGFDLHSGKSIGGVTC